MSYDLRLWTSKPVTPAALLAGFAGSVRQLNGVVLEGRNWVVAVDDPVAAEPEDVPEEVSSNVPGICCLTSASIEPITAPAIVIRKARSILKSLAKEFRGVVEDPQVDEILVPSGFKRFVAPLRTADARVSVLRLNYWFTESPLQTRNGIEALIQYLSRYLPDALPRRYGLFEPPSNKWSDGGAPALVDFLDRHVREKLVVMYPTRPCQSFTLGPNTAPGWVTMGQCRSFKCGYLELDFEFAALKDSAWSNVLRRAWVDLIKIVRPFASNVDVADGYILGRGGARWDQKTDLLTGGPWWGGIPKRLGLAFALSQEYAAHWPKFAAEAVNMDDMLVIEGNEWNRRIDLCETIGNAPEQIIEQVDRGWTRDAVTGGWTFAVLPERYPEIFPFPDKS